MFKCEGITGVLLKYIDFLDGTMLKACLKDQQLLKNIDMQLCDNRENVCCGKLRIVHIRTSPYVLMIDSLNLIVFQQTKYSPEDPQKNQWEDEIYHATMYLAYT